MFTSFNSGTPSNETWPGITSSDEFRNYNFPKYKPQPLINHAPRYLTIQPCNSCFSAMDGVLKKHLLSVGGPSRAGSESCPHPTLYTSGSTVRNPLIIFNWKIQHIFQVALIAGWKFKGILYWNMFIVLPVVDVKAVMQIQNSKMSFLR